MSSPTHIPASICIAQLVGITAPAIYSSLTFSYSYMVVPPIVAHAPEKLLAKQWLQAYQYAATFVPPLIISGTVSNIFLALQAPTVPNKLAYFAAAGLTFCIVPWTLLIFEPTINGAGKWKAQQLLRDEAAWQDLPEQKGLLPSPEMQTATTKSKIWAEGQSMRYLTTEWSRRNARRYVATAIAMGCSMLGTYSWLTGTLL